MPKNIPLHIIIPPIHSAIYYFQDVFLCCITQSWKPVSGVLCSSAATPSWSPAEDHTLEAPPVEMPGCLCCHSDPTPGVASSERPLAHPLSHSLAERPVVLFQALFTSDTFICLFISYPTSHAATAKSLQSCPTLCDPMAAHQAPVPGILQARTLEWVAISFSSA